MTLRAHPPLLCAIVAACGRGSSRSPDSASVRDLPPESTTASSTVSAAGQAQSPCPRTGLWALCSLEKRLKQSGFVAKRVAGEAPRRAGFSVTPAAYTLGHSRLEVFVYRDEAALARDLAGIDTLTASPRGKPSA